MSQGTAKGRGSAGGAVRRLRGRGPLHPFSCPSRAPVRERRARRHQKVLLRSAKRPETGVPPPRLHGFHGLRPLSSGLVSTPPRREGEEEPGPGRRRGRRARTRGGRRGGRSRGRSGGRGAGGRGAAWPAGRGAGPAGTRAPSGGGSRARPSPGRDRGGARGIPAGGAGHPVSPPPPKFPGGAAAALPSPAPGLGATLGRELCPRATGPPLQLDPAPPLRPTRIPNLGGAAGLRTRAFLAAAAAAAASSSRGGAGSGPSRAPRLAPRAPPSGSRSAAPAHADAGRPPGAPSPEGQLSADRRRRREVGPARRCPRQRQVWELH
ncbi:collagen alpha-2(I) chain-like [Mustela nigripes]|uniref:collagen alpha-2(I) chain-like n=1 Tax=Mustela nigripes TaxID=77151 RepID=UPI0028152F7E|nr:collagen alpha-2(I) chain-like [Mustela nigripes]